MWMPVLDSEVKSEGVHFSFKQKKHLSPGKGLDSYVFILSGGKTRIKFSFCIQTHQSRTDGL